MIDHVALIILAHAASAALSPEEAIQVLHVLPQGDSTLSAVLSRGFLEYSPALAIKHGHGLALLPHYPGYILFDSLYKTLGAAGALGDLQVLDDALPSQDLNGSPRLPSVVISDNAVAVLEWWHARFATSKVDWQRVCYSAIKNDARAVQLWLRDRMNLFVPDAATDQNVEAFDNACISALGWTVPSTLDFISAVCPALQPAVSPPEQAYTSMTILFWHCARAKVAIDDLLPLKPAIFESLFQGGDTIMLEWWAQRQLAAGHRLVFPTAEQLNDIYDENKNASRWIGE
ncbi:hypothetical protein BC828DRAFT_401736 [Blastocladiella britannica]|nr:hypothetical protein BC828DRAFT_401736 [Blastocladiella britannica]